LKCEAVNKLTQNVDTVANVNAGQDGGQDGAGASFNLRGLGENITLTLGDGVRLIGNAISTIYPDIALERFEVVLDGGSALYGSDAVAGVVNLIPIKEFDGISYVGAFEGAGVSSLMTFERPELLEFDYGYSSSGNPGVYREVVGGTPNIGGVHGGTVVSPSLRDPACGAFAQSPAETDLGNAQNNPGGIPIGTSQCFFTYSAQWPLMGEQLEANLYNNFTWDVNDWLELELSMNHSFRELTSRNTRTYGQNTNNRNALLIPADHPANTYGFDVVPQNYRPFTYLDRDRWPSHFENSTVLENSQSNTTLSAINLVPSLRCLTPGMVTRFTRSKPTMCNATRS
jgi:iron complex outermembrane receptor protein